MGVLSRPLYHRHPLPTSPIKGEVKGQRLLLHGAQPTERHLPLDGGGWEGVTVRSERPFALLSHIVALLRRTLPAKRGVAEWKPPETLDDLSVL